MIFYINGKIKKKQENNFISINNLNYKIDEIFVDNLNEQIEQKYYFYQYQELNFKNKITTKLYCFDSLEKINWFIELMNISGIGINTIENIFKSKISEFVKDLNYLSFAQLKTKYSLKENQIINIFKKFSIKSNEQNKNDSKQKNEMIQNLISLGYSKSKVNSIINRYYELFENKEMQEIIKKFVEILKDESKVLSSRNN